MTHEEEEGKQGFTARDLSSRAKLAGFATGVRREHHACRQDSLVQPCRLRFRLGQWTRRNAARARTSQEHPQSRLPHGGRGRRSLVERRRFCRHPRFGGGERRMLGGVVYNDRNRNRSYDPDEGVGDVAISTGTAETKSWKSGAYAVKLPKSGAKLSVELEGKKYVCSLPDGDENVKFDVVASDLPLIKQSGKLLAAIKKIPAENKTTRLIAPVELCMATRETTLAEEAPWRKSTRW